jgi:hypothetical protein
VRAYCDATLSQQETAMKTLNPLFAALALLLAGCTTPPPAPVTDTDQFIALDGQAPCAKQGNRLFVIDGTYVYWDRGATCTEQVHRLYGNTVEALLCVYLNAPQGARTECKEPPSVRTLFETIIKSRLEDGLGLGTAHKLTQLSLLPPQTENLPFTTVAKEAFSAIRTPRKLVIRDAAAWATLWAEHTAGQQPPPPLPQVDFRSKMLLAIFAGELQRCHEFEIRRVNYTPELKIIADFEDRDITPYSFCIAAITTPMHVVAVPEISADVLFKQITPVSVEFNTIDRTNYSGIESPRNVVVGDEAAWVALWREHTGSAARRPAIDFKTHMVVGVFRGVLPNGCYSTEIGDVFQVDAELNVHRVDTEPGQEAICTLAIVSPAHLVAIPRTDKAIVFSAERKLVPEGSPVTAR